MKRKLYLTFSVLFLCMMLLMPSLTKAGAAEGLLLWYRNLLPSMFPYTILSLYILGLSSAKNKRLGKTAGALTRFSGINSDGWFVCLTGFLCGYPLGAKMTGQLVCAKRITKEEGQYLLSFCNNASPAFLIQFVALGLMGSAQYAPALLISVYGAAVMTALFFHPHYCKMNQTACQVQTAQNSVSAAENVSVTISGCILEACEAMVRLCGYMVLFSIITKMVTAHIAAVTTWNAFLIGIIEITNGVSVIVNISSPLPLKLTLLAFCISFGGISCCAQSFAMCAGSGLSMTRYLFAKAVNAALASLIMLTLCGIGFI